MNIDFSLHPAQLDIFSTPARFKIVVAGRRFGKSYLSAICCIVEALKDTNDYGYDLKNTDVYYIAPTFQQGKDIMWRLLKNLAYPVVKSTYENTAVVEVINGRRIHIKGSDRPDSLRGVGLSFVVMDEYANMKPETWEAIIRPTLADVKGGALFIGTPAGKNHFYELYQQQKDDEDWAVFQYKSIDNPFLDKLEIENSRKTMAHELFKQEHEASFDMGSGTIFDVSAIIECDSDEAFEGNTYIAVDPAGYTEVEKKAKSKIARLDECAIAIATTGQRGWMIEDIRTGRWGVRETSLQILRAVQDYRPMLVGIEKGSLRNALMPYLNEQMQRLNIFPRITEVTHGNQKKTERIAWAIQGRLQNDRLFTRKFPMLNKLKDQMMDFPNPLSHDDMLDALAYIDQVASPMFNNRNFIQDSFAALDPVSGI